MAQANEQKNISFEDVWGKSASANIVSGKVAAPLCLGFLGVTRLPQFFVYERRFCAD